MGGKGFNGGFHIHLSGDPVVPKLFDDPTRVRPKRKDLPKKPVVRREDDIETVGPCVVRPFQERQWFLP